ncbi:odorant receptor 9a-like isoform X2 [Fopius arisanus]|nr:PREDICTED: odorant receptor 9a-like isoform X2 [Fopius arisanus]
MYKNIDELTAGLVEDMIVMLGITYYYVFATNMDWVRFTINNMRKDWKTMERSSTIRIMHTYGKKGYSTTTFYLVMLYTATCLYILLPMQAIISDVITAANQSESKLLIVKADYMIYGININNHYAAMLIHQLFEAVLLMSLIMTISTFMLIVVEHCCGLFVAVGELLQHVKGEFSTEQQDRIIFEAVEVHQRALTWADFIESLSTVMYGVLVLISMISISITGLQLIIRFNEPTEAVRFVACIGGQLVHLLFISIPGQEIYDHSIRLSMEIYNCNWFEVSPKAKKSILMMLMNSAKPVYLTAGKFYVLSLESYGKVLKASFSFLTMMRSSR